MSFLFKSKKNQQQNQSQSQSQIQSHALNHSQPPPPAAATRNIHTSEGTGSAPTSNPSSSLNGIREVERDSEPAQQFGSSSSSIPAPAQVNSSSPSPNQPPPNARRDRADSEPKALRNQPANGVQQPAAPNHALYPWSQRRMNFPSPQLTPFPRYGAAINAIASAEGDIYLMGGLVDGSTVKGDLWMIENSGNNSTCFPISPVTEGPGPRVGHASLLVGNALIVYGGDTKIHDNDTLDDTLYFLNTSSRQWSCAASPGPRPPGRYGHSLNLLGSKIYVFGGQVEGFFFNDLLAFDLNAMNNPGNKWEFLLRNSHDDGPPVGQVPPARTNHTMVTFNDKLYLFGGTNGVQWFNDVWAYDPRGNSWTQIDYVGFTPTPREGHAATLVGDVMYVFGGRTEEGVDLGDLIAFRISIRRWYSFHNMGPAPSPRSGHSMTTLGKNIIVLAGEPSSAPRDPMELGLVYVLDTTKIRYPNEQPTSPTGERPPRRVAQDGRPAGQSGRTSREAQHVIPDAQRRGPLGPARDPNGSPAGGSRLPRASIAQTPAGPPPSGQAPHPRANAIPPQAKKQQAAQQQHPHQQQQQQPQQQTQQQPHQQTQQQTQQYQQQQPSGKPDRSVSSSSDHNRSSEKDRQHSRDTSVQGSNKGVREHSPMTTATRQQHSSSRLSARAMEAGEAAPMVTPARQRSLRQQRQQNSIDSVDDSILASENRAYRNSRSLTDEPRSPRLTAHQEALIKELETMKTKNAWYVSELALARKAGYTPSSAPGSFEERSVDSFNEGDRPLVEMLLAMKTELAKMQANVDRQAGIASKRVAEVEHQRDIALNEAAYARARLAAHGGGGGSQGGTPMSEMSNRDLDESNSQRATEITRRLALALTVQNELKAKVESLSLELQEEKRAKELAEELHEMTNKRLTELELQNNPLELESMRVELHQLQSSYREETAARSEAEAALKMLQVDYAELAEKHEDISSRMENHGLNVVSLRDAVQASVAKAELMEQKLEEERQHRDTIERKLLQLRAEHEERTTELENTARRLREAEELADTHAKEAESHKIALLSGFDRVASRDSDKNNSLTDQRVAVLQSQVERANELVKTSQQAADSAAEKLRRAEERIAGLEAYQEQSSREGLQLRRQLQAALKENQTLNVENREVKAQLENQQRDTNALAIQHGALKDLLGERGMNMSDSRRSPMLDSPGSRYGTPEQNRLRELEQQLQSSLKAHEETKSSFEYREQEVGRAYSEKLEQLENDYQSAVHYVKGTEKVLKRMKEELAKYKSQTAKLQAELAEVSNNSEAGASREVAAPPEWEAERDTLHQSISELQSSTAASISSLENKLLAVQAELASVQKKYDESRSEQEALQAELSSTTEKGLRDLEQLKKENILLESRAMDAEKKVSMLLDQVESSVTNYRRQSQQVASNMNANGANLSRNVSNASSAANGPHANRPRADSNVSQDDTLLNHRGSMALDSLANELDALRSHWETANRSYRISTQFDFDQTPTKETYSEGLSDSLANWRRRLDEEEARADEPSSSQQQQSPNIPTPQPAQPVAAGNIL
ncbi:kelch-domain-containing protein [Nannizzia gypsea CBS 118893]|uniref:Kelch-domain-containing protein n=1 Tax=Arthroderma gypseum (strain ATCC MYA-4604 / CBS 118893) TaxID=535722 RepID=E5R060_ARTGP|nr:kelch-domain-containing protein [Nannizzia gypsea CBS 118893]EFQ97471.1 kelch-domain-containing protein [Nannizzia gypsea CBS 118893]